MQITGKSTDKAKIRKFAQLIDGLVVLEEFSNSIGDNGFQWLKGLNDRNGYERGTIDSNFGTDNVPITSGVILTGNDYPQNDALLTRLVVIEMLKNTTGIDIGTLMAGYTNKGLSSKSTPPPPTSPTD